MRDCGSDANLTTTVLLLQTENRRAQGARRRRMQFYDDNRIVMGAILTRDGLLTVLLDKHLATKTRVGLDWIKGHSSMDFEWDSGTWVVNCQRMDAYLHESHKEPPANDRQQVTYVFRRRCKKQKVLVKR